MKKMFVVLLGLVLLVVFSGCSSTSSSSGSQGKPVQESDIKSEFKLKLGHVGPSDPNHPWEKYALEFAKQIDEKTNGRVKVETYPSSQLGADREMTEALQTGTMDIGLISTIAMGNFVPEYQVWDLPYIWPTDNNKVDEILDGPIAKELSKKAQEKGLHTIAYWENDWRGMSNSKRPIKSVSDLDGLKMRVVENKPSLDWFERVGAIPTPMAFSELYTALQQGTIDGQDNGTILTYGSKLYEAQKFYTNTRHIYAPLAFIVSEKTWKKLPEDIQKEIQSLAEELAQPQRDYNRKLNKEYAKKMEESGIEINSLSESAIDEFREISKGTYEALADDVGQDLIDKMLKARE